MVKHLESMSTKPDRVLCIIFTINKVDILEPIFAAADLTLIIPARGLAPPGSLHIFNGWIVAAKTEFSRV